MLEIPPFAPLICTAVQHQEVAEMFWLTFLTLLESPLCNYDI